MADDKGKKSDKKPTPKPPTHPAEPVIIMFAVVTILGAVVVRFGTFLGEHRSLAQILNTLWLFLQGEATFVELLGATGSPGLITALFLLKIFLFAFSAFMVWAIISAARKYSAESKKIFGPLKNPGEVSYDITQTPKEYVNPKWTKVLEHINSPNQSDWKLAILEADIMLSDMLDKMSYHGATIGDKLKSIEPSDFSTLQEAWEAHKIRNAIAHEGSDYPINKPEAERVIKLFKKVFEEFHYI